MRSGDLVKTCLNCTKELVNKQKLYCSRPCKAHYRRTVVETKAYQTARTNKYRGKDMTSYLQSLIHKKARSNQISINELMEIYNKQNGRCALTGEVLTHICGGGRTRTNASLDRIIPGGPYTKDNVRIVCHVANIMRTDMSDIELRYWAEKIIKGT